MVDLVPRPDRYAISAPDLDSVNGLIQARIDGVISRRELHPPRRRAGDRRARGRRDAPRHLRYGLWRALSGSRRHAAAPRRRVAQSPPMRRPRPKASPRRAAR